MLEEAFALSLLPLFSIIFSLSWFPGAKSYMYVRCSQVYFNSTTPYEMNVNSLFTSLVDAASFSNFNESEISAPPPIYSQNDVVYGLFQCQGDLSYSNCRDCVANSVTQLKATCPISTGGTIQSDGCFVKYDGTSFFGVEDKTEVLKRCGPSDGYNSDGLNRVDVVLADLISGNEQYFRLAVSGSVQGVAQCIQDLSLSDCEDCVLEARKRLRLECETSTWGDMYLGKCYIRYVDRGVQPNNGNGNNNKQNNINSNSNNNKKDTDGRKLALEVIGIIVGLLVGGSLTYAVSVSVTNVNIINVKKEVEKIADETTRKVEAVEKKAEEEVEKATRKADEANRRVEEVDKKAEKARQKAKEAKRKVKEVKVNLGSVASTIS